jgi:hypothetical protein
MASVRVIKKEKPKMKSVLIRQRKSKKWSAWLADDPSISAGGKTGMAAVGFLVRDNPDVFGVKIIPLEEKKKESKPESVDVGIGAEDV